MVKLKHQTGDIVFDRKNLMHSRRGLRKAKYPRANRETSQRNCKCEHALPKSNLSPGEDGIMTEVLKLGGEDQLNTIQNLFNI